MIDIDEKNLKEIKKVHVKDFIVKDRPIDFTAKLSIMPRKSKNFKYIVDEGADEFYDVKLLENNHTVLPSFI
jgi:hypothetical protein